MTRFAKYATAFAAVLLAVVAVAVAVRRNDDDEPATQRSTVTMAGATAALDTSGETTGADENGGTGTTTVGPSDTPENTTTTGTTTDPTPPPYALAPTRRCLRSAGFAVSSVRSSDPRLRALGDLAQRTSLEVRREGRTLGLAFGDTRLLESLLRVPNDPYTIEIRRNALLMYLPGAGAEAAVLRRCLAA